MKGISPLVAAVLLIAATMSIAGILAFWASSFVRTQTEQFENQTVTTQCNFADLRVYSCNYNSTNHKISFILENIRTVELKELKAYLVFTNGSVSSEIPLNATLPSGVLKSFTITDVDPEFNKLEVKTQCPEVRASSGCR